MLKEERNYYYNANEKGSPPFAIGDIFISKGLLLLWQRCIKRFLSLTDFQLSSPVTSFGIVKKYERKKYFR
jgi:hypothetical protein